LSFGKKAKAHFNDHIFVKTHFAVVRVFLHLSPNEFYAMNVLQTFYFHFFQASAQSNQSSESEILKNVFFFDFKLNLEALKLSSILN